MAHELDLRLSPQETNFLYEMVQQVWQFGGARTFEARCVLLGVENKLIALVEQLKLDGAAKAPEARESRGPAQQEEILVGEAS